MVQTKRNFRIVIILLVISLIISIVFSLLIGRFEISITEVGEVIWSSFSGRQTDISETKKNVIMALRLPRLIGAILIGTALSVSGATYQSMFKNPMVSPDLLGVTSGASLGASFAILSSMGTGLTQLFAFLGGILAVLTTVNIARIMRNQSTMMLVLSGVVVGGLVSSLMNLIKYVADADTALQQIIFWTMGSLAKVQLREMVIPSFIIVSSTFLLYKLRYQLNILSLGEKESRTLGVNSRRVQFIFILLSTLLTATAVCLAGSIGWIGLVIPHLARMLVGADNKKVIPVSILLGSIFMVIIDVVARSLTNAELPLGVITGIIGAPFYIALLIKGRRTIQ